MSKTKHRHLTHLQREGMAESAAWGARFQATTGLAPMPRGMDLVRHVALGIAGDEPAAKIAGAVGYRVDRCAQLLAACGHAPLARQLLARDSSDLWAAYFKGRAA